MKQSMSDAGSAGRRLGRPGARIRAGLASLLLGTLAAACSPYPAGAQPAPVASGEPTTTVVPGLHPVSGLAVIPLTVTTRKGPHTFRVEVAASPEEQERGLMWRRTMAPDEGMIFPMSPARRTAFWMRNTVIGLDIVFIGADHRVLNIAARAIPYDETPLPSAGLSAGVLELNAGRAAEIGLKPGDRVDW